MKNFILGFIAAFLLIPGVALACFALGWTEVRSDLKPSSLETRIMRSAVRGSVRRGASALPAPPPATNEAIIAGGKLYALGCMGCHGEPGKPPSDFGVTFNPPAPQFLRVGTQYTQAQAFYVAKHGIRRSGMTAQADSYNDLKIWALVAFITNMPNLPPAVVTAIQPKQANP